MMNFQILRRVLLVMIFALSITSCEVLEALLHHSQTLQSVPLTKEEVVKGLKEALRVGTDTAVKQLTRTNGFYGDALVKLALPKEAKVITDNLSKIPLVGPSLITESEKLINKSAEDAAKKAGPIFASAITNMSIADAFGLLKGVDTAATSYLRKTTYKKLFDAFKPVISQSLNKDLVGGISAEKSYTELISKYNTVAKIPLSGMKPITSNSLTNYTTHKALQGLFKKVALEEKDIRKDPMARVNDILKRVFAEQ